MISISIDGELGTFRVAVVNRGPRSSRFLRLIPDPLLLDMGIDDDVNVIGGTFPCESKCKFVCKCFGIRDTR